MVSSLLSKHDGRVSLSDQTYTRLRKSILELDVAPGSSLTESELAADLGVSKAPVREALARLRREGLVESIARSGYQVRPVTVKDARDLFGLRSLLEVEAAGLAASAGGVIDHLRELDELAQAAYDPTDRSSIIQFLSANRDLHVGIARFAGNQRITHALEQVLDQLLRYFHLALPHAKAEVMVHEHRDLLSAILSGNQIAAREIALAQARSSQAMVIDALLSSDAVLSTNLASGGN